MSEMSMSGFDLDPKEVVRQGARMWWLFLLTGIAWIVVAWLVLQWDYTTVSAISYLFGFLALFMGVNEFMMIPGTSAGWKILHGALGLLLVAGGIFALVNPFDTFVGLASLVGLFFIIKGTFDIVVSVATRDEIHFWWMQLIVGIIELLLGFWASGPGFATYGRQVVLLVVWVGIAALFRGITEIVFAFKLRSAGKALA